MARGRSVPIKAPQQARFLAPQRQKMNTVSLTASAERSTTTTSPKYRSLIQPWQQDAFRFYSTLGEVWYAAQFYARISSLRLYAARQNEQGEIEELPAGSKEAALLDRIQDPGGGGYNDLLASYGRLMFLSGDGYLTVTKQGALDESWEFLSCNEMRAQAGGGYVRYAAPSLSPETLNDVLEDSFEPLEKSAVVWRFWRRSPEFSKLSDSPMRGVLNICEELLLLELAVRARARSRASQSGLLYIPDEMDFANPTGLNEEDPDQNAFQSRLQEMMITPIRDPGDASSVVPGIIRGPASIGGVPAKDAMFLLKIHDPMETYPEEGLRTELRTRFAVGVDMPPEVLLGTGDTNHWASWKIDDDTWKSHLKPLADRFVRDIGAAYLRPSAESEGIADWETLTVGYDATEIVSNPDKSQNAKQAFSDGAIGYKSYRQDLGYTEADKQTDEEHEEYLAIKLRDPLMLDGEEGEQPETDSSGTRTGSEETVESIPDEESARLEMNEQGEDIGLAASLATLLGGAELAVLRSRELAGARLNRFAMKECPECVRDLAAPKTLLAAAIGQDLGQKAGGATKLVEGGAESFVEFTMSALGLSREVGARLASLIERHAADSLYNETVPTLPPGFTSYAKRFLKAANGRAEVHAAA